MRRLAFVLMCLFTSACSGALPSAEAARGFVDIVWKVDSSTAVAPGTLYVFLSDGTLVITRPGDKPMTGTWSRAGGEFTMIEDGLSYRTEIRELTPKRFRIRSHNPGQPVDISLVRAN